MRVRRPGEGRGYGTGAFAIHNCGRDGQTGPTEDRAAGLSRASLDRAGASHRLPDRRTHGAKPLSSVTSTSTRVTSRPRPTCKPWFEPRNTSTVPGALRDEIRGVRRTHLDLRLHERGGQGPRRHVEAELQPAIARKRRLDGAAVQVHAVFATTGAVVLLPTHREQVEPAIVVEIGDLHRERAVVDAGHARVHRLKREHAVLFKPVLEHHAAHRASAVLAEAVHEDEVLIAIVVEVPRHQVAELGVFVLPVPRSTERGVGPVLAGLSGRYIRLRRARVPERQPVSVTMVDARRGPHHRRERPPR